MTKSYYKEHYNYLYREEYGRIRESREKQTAKMTERIHNSFKEIKENGCAGYLIRN